MNYNIHVVICSVNRTEVLHQTVVDLSRQTRRANQILICVGCEADVLGETVDLDRVKSIVSPRKGLTIQRNFAIDNIPNEETGIVVFLDDDVVLELDYLKKVEELFQRTAELQGVSSQVVVDGNITFESAKEKMTDYTGLPAESLYVRPKGKDSSCHGCNMSFRRSVLEKERFDESLPLYSFAEDYDISIRVGRHGLVGKVDVGLGIIHLEHKGGRVTEFRRGYSMVANNFHFLKKGVSHLPICVGYFRFWSVIVLKETSMDFIRAVKQWIRRDDREFDYAGRCKGRIRAGCDVLMGRSSPARILELVES